MTVGILFKKGDSFVKAGTIKTFSHVYKMSVVEDNLYLYGTDNSRTKSVKAVLPVDRVSVTTVVL